MSASTYFTVPKIKVETDSENSLPKCPAHQTSNWLLASTVEVIDLTDEQYLNEFRSFLDSLAERRVDKESKRNTTKTKSMTVQGTLCAPVDYLESIHFQQDAFICELFRFNFRNVMLYGRLTAKSIKDDFTIYQLDDGTGRVDIYYRPENKRYEDNLTKLQHCEDLLRRKITPLNEESVPQSGEMRKHLRLLVLLAMAQCCKRLNSFELETYCFAVGNPFMGRDDKVSVFAHSILPDDNGRKSCELFWKSILLSIYEPLITSSVAAPDTIS